MTIKMIRPDFLLLQRDTVWTLPKEVEDQFIARGKAELVIEKKKETKKPKGDGE